MRYALSAGLCCGLLAGFLASPAEAQNLTVQQPVFGVNSVGTTVSVPDRGSALLGGVSSAGASRSRYGSGPFRPGSTSGQFHSASSSSVSVTIHDFAEMDRYLNSLPDAGHSGSSYTGSSFSGRGSRLTGGAADAWRSLQARTGQSGANSPALSRAAVLSRAGSASTGPASGGFSPPASAPVSAAQPAAEASTEISTASRSLQLGYAALDRGSRNVARMHFRMAARRGSQQARDELARLRTDSGSPALARSAGSRAAKQPE